jgi:hypothetical protein
VKTKFFVIYKPQNPRYFFMATYTDKEKTLVPGNGGFTLKIPEIMKVALESNA